MGIFLLAAAALWPACVNAQTLSSLESSAKKLTGQTNDKPDTKKLDKSLDDVIGVLENDKQRRDLLKQLKSLRAATAAEQDRSNDANHRHGLLGALADSFTDLSAKAKAGDSPVDIWSRNARIALDHAERNLGRTGRPILVRNLSEGALGLAIWLALLLGLMAVGRRWYRQRGWPLILHPEPRPWMLAAHFARRVLPWLLVFLLLLAVIRLLEAPAAPSAVVLVVAYSALCGRLLSTVFDVVISLFTPGHRRVAVALLHQKALVPLFVIGVLVAFGDAVNSERLVSLLGNVVSDWLSVVANVLAGLLTGVLVIRIKRPVEHLIRNRSYRRRVQGGSARDLISVLAGLWHIPALLMIGASLAAIFLTGGQTHAAFAKAMICTVLLVVTLVIIGLIRRADERSVRRWSQRRRRSLYANRLTRFGFALLHCLSWLVFAELSLRVWGFSLFGFGERGAVSARIRHALLGMGITILIAWLVWILLDTAIQRALSGGRDARGKPRNTNRAQTITPMIRNMATGTILIIATIAGLANLGVNVTPLLAGAGVIGLAIGFGAQTLVQDLITGIFILIEDSLAVGDFVEINGFMGTVEGLNLRAVRLRDLDGVLHITTFSHIKAIHNMSRQFGIALIKIRMPFDMRIDDAITLMRRTASDLHRDPFLRGLIRSHLEIQGIHEFQDGCPILRARLRTAPEYQWDVSRAFNLALKRRMENEYINLGAPRLSVSMEAGGGSRYGKRGKPSEDGGQVTPDVPADGQASPDPG
jgi:small-conductance mechanosensitive channel